MKRKPISTITAEDIDAIDDINELRGLIKLVVKEGMVKDSSITLVTLALLLARMAALSAVQETTIAGLRQEVETLKKKVK